MLNGPPRGVPQLLMESLGRILKVPLGGPSIFSQGTPLSTLRNLPRDSIHHDTPWVSHRLSHYTMKCMQYEVFKQVSNVSVELSPIVSLSPLNWRQLCSSAQMSDVEKGPLVSKSSIYSSETGQKEEKEEGEEGEEGMSSGMRGPRRRSEMRVEIEVRREGGGKRWEKEQ